MAEVVSPLMMSQVQIVHQKFSNFRRLIHVLSGVYMHRIDPPTDVSNLPDVPRPKSERPEAIAAPKIAEGQAERLLRSRQAKGWSLRDLAAASGVSVRTILAIESGAAKGATGCITMARLADALHVPRGWLAFGG